MKTLRKWVFIRQHDTHIELSIDEKHCLCLYVLESDLVRVLTRIACKKRVEKKG